VRRALAYEWVRVRTLRSTWWLTALAVFLGIGISTLFSWAVHHDFSTGHGDFSDVDVIGQVATTQLAASGAIPSVVCFVLAIIGIFSWGHEYRHGMIRASLTALTSRRTLWAAKYVVVGIWVAVVALVTLALSALVSNVFLHEWIDVLDAKTVQVIGWQVLYGVLLTWLAMAFTSITRSQAFALTSIFLWPFLIENLLMVFFRLVPQLRDNVDLLRFRPFAAGARMVDVVSASDSTFGDPLSHVGGLVVFGGLTAVAMVVSSVLFSERDA
jgi:ABC-2 type transport system permease protein